MSKAKVSDILSEIFKKIGSKENTKEVGWILLSLVHFGHSLAWLAVSPLVCLMGSYFLSYHVLFLTDQNSWRPGTVIG